MLNIPLYQVPRGGGYSEMMPEQCQVNTAAEQKHFGKQQTYHYREPKNCYVFQPDNPIRRVPS